MRFGFAGDVAFVAIGDIALCHFLSRAVHQFKFHQVLNLFDTHGFRTGGAYAVGYALYQCLVLA